MTAAPNHTAIYYERLRLKTELKDALENLQYWKRQTALRTDPDAKAKAAGLASAWQTTADAKQAAIDALPNNHDNR